MDADACPVKNIITGIAAGKNIPVIMVKDTSHIIDDGYSLVITVDKGNDSADIAIANVAGPGDIVITQDYGVAAMAMAKGARAMDQNGRLYTEGNIDRLMLERYINRKVRHGGGRIPGPPKRAKKNNDDFRRTLKGLLEDMAF